MRPGSEEEFRECPTCKSKNELSHRFCTQCGRSLDEGSDEKMLAVKHRFKGRVLVTIGSIVLYILGNGYLHWRDMGISPLYFQFFFLLLVGFLIKKFPGDLKGAASMDRTFPKSTWIYLGLQSVITVLVFFLNDMINEWGSYSEPDPLADYRGHSAPLLMALLSIAVFPPITEELAFRGLLFGQLSELTVPRVVISVTAFLFAWVHFSFISLIWLFPAGIFLGWVRSREGIIWPCIYCHAIHNSAAVLSGL